MTSGTNSPSPGWLLDELATAGRENLDPSHVSRYDLIEDADANDEAELLLGLGMGPKSLVVDIGSGTGQFAIAASPLCGRVIAVDVSAPMLQALRTKLDSLRLDNVDVIEAGFLTYEHQGEPADFLYSRYAMHHIPDFWKGVALARLHDALRPGGVLRIWDVVYNVEPTQAPEALERWCSTGGPERADAWSRADYEEHVRDEHSTYTWVFELLASRAGFVVERADYSDDGIFAKYVLRRPKS